MSYIYLASPYSHTNPDVRQHRYEKILEYSVAFTKKGEVVFSPIVHSHPMSTQHGLSGNYSFWRNIDETFIKNSDYVRVMMMPGWDESQGIKEEIKYAVSIGKRVDYYEC